MSYYTGPSEQHLMPLRLRIAAHGEFVDDVEMRRFVTRDLRLFLARRQLSAITEAYSVASVTGQRFIENQVADIDPSALESLRAAIQR